jgi:hypothetical protein
MAGMERHVRTAAGTSITTYQQEPDKAQIEGEGQGKGDSMAVWTLISSVLLEVHKSLCHGIELINVTGKLRVRQSNDAYVDDSDTYGSAPKTNTAMRRWITWSTMNRYGWHL